MTTKAISKGLDYTKEEAEFLKYNICHHIAYHYICILIDRILYLFFFYSFFSFLLIPQDLLFTSR